MTCKTCGETKTSADFYWREGRPRLSEGCKKCYNAAASARLRDRDRGWDNTTSHLRNESTRDKAEAHRQPWTHEDEEIVRTFYSDPDVSLEELAAALGRTLHGIHNRAMVLKHREASAIPDRRNTCLKNRPEGV